MVQQETNVQGSAGSHGKDTCVNVGIGQNQGVACRGSESQDKNTVAQPFSTATRNHMAGARQPIRFTTLSLGTPTPRPAQTNMASVTPAVPTVARGALAGIRPAVIATPQVQLVGAKPTGGPLLQPRLAGAPAPIGRSQSQSNMTSARPPVASVPQANIASAKPAIGRSISQANFGSARPAFPSSRPLLTGIKPVQGHSLLWPKLTRVPAAQSQAKPEKPATSSQGMSDEPATPQFKPDEAATPAEAGLRDEPATLQTKPGVASPPSPDKPSDPSTQPKASNAQTSEQPESCNLANGSRRKAGGETCVSATNDSSIASKLSAVEKGYFSDPFVKHFCLTPKRRAPLINRGYGLRYLAIDYVFENLFSRSTPDTQVVVLGAGFDTLYFRHRSKEFSRWIEVDFPDVIRRKKECIQHSLHEHVDERYYTVGVDLRELDKLEKMLAEVCDFEAPTIVLAEVVLTYLPTEDADAILRWLAGTFKNCALIMYEQIRPFTTFGTIMCRHFDKIGSSICSLVDYPTLRDQEKRIASLGFSVRACMDLCDFESRVTSAIREWQELEFFDEYEEWMLKKQHYMLMVASVDTLRDSIQPAPFYSTHHEIFEPTEVYIPVAEFVDDSVVNSKVQLAYEILRKRVPDTSSSLGTIEEINSTLVPCVVKRMGFAMGYTDKGFVVYGGFGPDANGNHCRLNSAILTTDFQSAQDIPIEHTCPMFACLHGEIPCGGRCGPNKVAPCPGRPRWRHSLAEVDDGIVICGGRDATSVLDDVWKLEDGQWIELPGLVTPRCSMATCVLQDGTVMAFGGLDENECGIGEAVDILTGQVYPFAATFGAKAVAYKHGALVAHDGALSFWSRERGSRTCKIRHTTNFLMINFHMCMMPNRKLCLVGGGGNLFSFGTHINEHMLQVDLDDVDEMFGLDQVSAATLCVTGG